MSTNGKPFYGSQHDSPEAKAARAERNRKIVELLSDHTVTEVAETFNLTTGTVSQVARKAGLPPRWIHKRADDAAAKSEQVSELEPSLVIKEWLFRPKERQPARKLPPAKGVGFDGYNAVYMGCATCGYRTWQAPDKPSVCPRCNYPLQIVYTPKVGE
jgi:hypothetical protein